MNRLKLVLLVAALALPVSSTQALEWGDYDGTIPDNAVMLNEGTEDAVVCRHNAKVGLVTDAGVCHSVALGSTKVKKKTQDDGYEILVDNSENEMAEALGSATDSMISQDEADEQIETAGAEAAEDMYTQEEYDAK